MTPALWAQAGAVLSATFYAREAGAGVLLLLLLAHFMPLVAATALAGVAACAYLSLRAHLRRREKRRAQQLMLGAVEAMIDESKVTLSPEQILQAGALRAQSGARGTFGPRPGEGLAGWASRLELDASGPLRAVLEHAPDGLPLAPYLTLVADEMKNRSHLAAEQDAATAALSVVTYIFLAAVLVALFATLARSGPRHIFFGSPSGLALLVWVLLSTSLCLALPLVRDHLG